jgi:hypothetical protein
MKPRAPLDPRLLEALSAYLDGRLEGTEKAALEERLAREEDLRLHLSELQTVRDSLRTLPSIKPPRALTLTPALAGIPAPRAGWFSRHGMALGSALAALAFVAVTSVDLLSQVSMASAPRPAAESFSAPIQVQSAENLALGGGGTGAPTLAARPTLAPTMPSMEGPREKTGYEEDAAATEAPPPAEPASDGCGESAGVNKAADRCGLTDTNYEGTAPYSFSLPDFRTLAPYLEVLLGSTAVILAALAIFFRRRK